MRSPPQVACAAAMRRCRRESKLLACPHCRRIGWLIGHGFLRGYASNGRDQRLRGRRFFCSNRNRRRGCGRTCSVLLSIFLFRRTVRALHLWRLWGAAAIEEVRVHLGVLFPGSICPIAAFQRHFRRHVLA